MTPEERIESLSKQIQAETDREKILAFCTELNDLLEEWQKGKTPVPAEPAA
jgi:hypothetical protein